MIARTTLGPQLFAYFGPKPLAWAIPPFPRMQPPMTIVPAAGYFFAAEWLRITASSVAREDHDRSTHLEGEPLMTVDRRREPRVESNLPVLIWGIDARGLPFAQKALARNISGHGALLCGIDHLLRCGDLIAVQYGKQRARFRVVWTRDSANGEKVRAAVQRLKAEECPWKEALQFVAAESCEMIELPVRLPLETKPGSTDPLVSG